jgi:hypothetical protein
MSSFEDCVERGVWPNAGEEFAKIMKQASRKAEETDFVVVIGDIPPNTRAAAPLFHLASAKNRKVGSNRHIPIQR